MKISKISKIHSFFIFKNLNILKFSTYFPPNSDVHGLYSIQGFLNYGCILSFPEFILVNLIEMSGFDYDYISQRRLSQKLRSTKILT